MVTIWYSPLTGVKRAADIPTSANLDSTIADAMDEATDAVHELCRRVFYPTLDTRYFAWPPHGTQSARVVELNENEMISVVSVTNGDGSVISGSHVSLGNPVISGAPYSRLYIDSAFTQASTFPDLSLAVLGVYGFQIQERIVATTTGQLAGTTVNISDSSRIGVGSLLRIADERIVVTAMGWLDSANLVVINLTADETADSFAVTNGALFFPGEELLIGSEKMRINYVVGNTLYVERAIDGTTLAVHATATLYVNRKLTVERAVLGTTAVDTALGASVYLFRFPGLVRQLHRAETLNILQQDIASYGRSSGSGEGETALTTDGLADLRKRCFHRYGRWLSGAV
jgi:hypothetical protein